MSTAVGTPCSVCGELMQGVGTFVGLGENGPFVHLECHRQQERERRVQRARDSEWIQTYTGGKFWPLDPQPDDVDITDIAHGLALTTRYNRQAKFPYSVAQHSVLLADNCPAEMALLALMHDAHEAYSPFGDVSRPVKGAPGVKVLVESVEDRIDRAIATKFSLPWPIKNKAIAALDTRILLDERAQVLTHTTHVWGLPADLKPLGVHIEPWSWQVARERFLGAFDRYSKLYRSPEAV